MRTLCDACENSAAVVFCAADEAALCSSCDDKVHSCNKLASRHIRVGLAIPSDVPRCDICENAPAFFYCEIDGTSLCLQCDTNVHVGGKRMHSRYLLLRQRVEFPGDKSSRDETLALQAADQGETRRGQNPFSRSRMRDPARTSEADSDGHVKMDTKMIDLNIKPFRVHEHASDNHQDQ